MRWDDLRTSENVEDRRGDGGGFGGGGGSGFGLGGGRLGIGAIVVLSLAGWALGIDPRILIGGAEMVTGGRAPTQESRSGPTSQPTDDSGRFVAKILGETEDVWSQLMPAQANREYRAPRLVLFSRATQSACGSAQSAMGPFYCPLDQKVYLDTSFFQDMQRRSGDKAQANNLSVRVELMADCLAGVWAAKMNEKRRNIDENDVRNAVNAATAIGDDRLQKQGQGYAVPDSFTHGSSEQRVRWLMTGLKSGDLRTCNTFQTQRL